MHLKKRSSLLILLILIWVAACQNKSKDIVIPTLIVLPSATPSPLATETPTSIPTSTPTLTPSATNTPLPTASYTPSRVPTMTFTFTPSPTVQGAAPAATATPAAQAFDGLAAQIDRASIIQTIADLQNFQNRYTNSESIDGFHGIQAARSYLESRLTALADTCAAPANFYENSFDIVYQQLPSTQSNLVLEVPGTEPGSGVIIVGGHYDTMSRLARDHRDFGLQPGADDNGSGVSVTLELARLFCLQPHRKTMVFVLFAAEEIRLDNNIVGRVGSRYFVEQFLPNRGWRVDAMLNLDTIGSATDVRGAIIDDFARLYSAPPVEGPSRQLARRIQAASYVQMPNFRLNVEVTEDRENRWGDHMTFTRAGFAAARLFEGSEDIERQDSQFDLLNDLDPPYLLNNTKVVLAFLMGESEGTSPPQNININGNLVTWETVPEVKGYLVGQRGAGESNYTYSLLPADERGIELPSGTIFAIGSIGSNGLLGTLSPEAFVP